MLFGVKRLVVGLMGLVVEIRMLVEGTRSLNVLEMGLVAVGRKGLVFGLMMVSAVRFLVVGVYWLVIGIRRLLVRVRNLVVG